MKTITIHAGHNPKGKISCGASDYIDESTEARWIVKEVKKLLQGKVNYIDVTVNDGKNQTDILEKLVDRCNRVSRDYDISVHFNANKHLGSDGKTTGTECYVYSKSGARLTLANEICKNIASLGFKNRGVKEGKGLYIIKNTDRPCILIEVCFVDDKDDADLYKKKKSLVAQAIANAIIKCG